MLCATRQLNEYYTDLSRETGMGSEPHAIKRVHHLIQLWMLSCNVPVRLDLPLVLLSKIEDDFAAGMAGCTLCQCLLHSVQRHHLVNHHLDCPSARSVLISASCAALYAPLHDHQRAASAPIRITWECSRRNQCSSRLQGTPHAHQRVASHRIDHQVDIAHGFLKTVQPYSL